MLALAIAVAPAKSRLTSRSKKASAAASGAAVICASSDYEQLAAICSRVLIFVGGRVVATLEGAAISKEAIAERSLGGASQESQA